MVVIWGHLNKTDLNLIDCRLGTQWLLVTLGKTMSEKSYIWVDILTGSHYCCRLVIFIQALYSDFPTQPCSCSSRPAYLSQQTGTQFQGKFTL